MEQPHNQHQPNNSPENKLASMQTALKENLSRQIQFMRNSCVNCGLCADACHYCFENDDPAVIPANKMHAFSTFLNKYFHPVKSRLPGFSHSDLPNEQALTELYQAAFQNCSICGKCALTCPMGINTGEILYLARAMLLTQGRIPSGLIDTVENALSKGNHAGLSKQDFIENMEWIAEEMEEDIGDESFTIPIDKKNAGILYIPHPLEVRDFPFLLMYALKILHYARADYTVSSHGFDTVNYAYYQGSKTNMMRIAQRVLDAREKIQAKSIVLAPCGHGYRVLRWEVDKYMGKTVISPPVRTIVELVDCYIQEGRIKLEKDKFKGPITFHDPCNLGRRGGVIDAPRNIIKALTSNFVEMQPHGMRNFCCGGGGGLASTGAFGKVRLNAGKRKAEQIRQTGAKIVVTNCFNCLTQIRDLIKTYDLGIEVKSILELTAESLIE
jgi:Fe-S oxidoreductase